MVVEYMSERVDAILDAAEQRIRSRGYNGFSFREVAADVGIKSASVHHHFPTKADLATAVAKRYRERFEAAVAEDEAAGTPRIEAWRRAFRRSLVDDGLMCLCGILAVEGSALPEPVAAEARLFFERGVAAINEGQTDGSLGHRVVAQLEGAMLLARSLDEPSVFDAASEGLPR